MTVNMLWRCLTNNDFNAMNGEASTLGKGAGAVHVALGVSSMQFPIGPFLGAKGLTSLRIHALGGGNLHAADLIFYGNPNRRGGEWLIGGQYAHRHPAWTQKAGFPSVYDDGNPPYLLVFRDGDNWHARFILKRDLERLRRTIEVQAMLDRRKGVGKAPTELLAVLQVPATSLADRMVIQAEIEPMEPFDPRDKEDGRQRVLASIVRRQGQHDFRRKLLAAYGRQCAMSRCKIEFVLEACHIVPFLGTRTNVVPNGLLLRADIHTLFDLALIAIEPGKRKIRVSSALAGSQYDVLNGKRPALPSSLSLQPNADALEEHYALFKAQ